MENVKIAMVLFGFGFVLSLAAMRYKKPDGKLFSPVWRLRENYTTRGVTLNLAALGLLLAGALFYLFGAR